MKQPKLKSNKLTAKYHFFISWLLFTLKYFLRFFLSPLSPIGKTGYFSQLTISLSTSRLREF